MIQGLGMFYSRPLGRDGVPYRGVVSAEHPSSLLPHIDRRNWVLLHCQHCARPPVIDAQIDLYQCDPYFDDDIFGHPIVHAIPRDFVDERIYRPLGIEKRYDVVFNACWSEVKRPLLFASALRFAHQAGRSISCLWYGYHWTADSVGGTSPALEEEVRTAVADLPVTFMDTEWGAAENNRRFNLARVAVLTSNAEGGPRVMSEAMLAGLPYLAAADVAGGSAAYLTPQNRNGGLFQPTPESIARAIWSALDTLDRYRPRKWALANMCRRVAVARLKHALRDMERKRGWHINWQDVDHDGSAWSGWWEPVIEADAAGDLPGREREP